MGSYWLIRIIAVAFIVNECGALNITHIIHHRRAHRHERSRHRRQYRDEDGRPFLLVGGAGSESGPWSGWSEPTPCSRTCGGGVAYQERQCIVESACTGAPRRYFSCNIEDCPEGSMDFRAEQCAAYNDIEFEGLTYDWIPYTKAENKCQLNCMPRGERFYYRHEEKVHDGTLCREDSLDVCVDGECMPVGCDRLLGSTTKEDACRVCGGDGSTCTTVSGVLENNDLISGYNDLLLIPEGATNIKINERRPSSNYLAIRNKTGHYYLNGNWRIDFPRSLRFAGTVFTYSRKQFVFMTPESITALGPTTEAIFIVLLYQERNPGIEYTYSIPKGTVHETSPQGYGWQFGEWSPCNTTCGSGYQYREVWCALRQDSSRASNDLCDPTTEPSSVQHCSLTACPPTWTTGPWGPCSVTCGAKGTQTRQVFCTQDDGSGRPLYKDDSACAEAGPKPELSQTCEETPHCPSLHIGPWKPCDHLCGDGKQRRDIHCYQKSEGKITVLPLSMCGQEVPEREKPCNLRPCEGLDWITGEWSGCEDKCGLAFETRTAYCGVQNGRPYPESLCHAYRKPELVRNCSYTPCASQWYASQWSACSSKCGTGVQTRTVFCAAFEGESLKKVDDSKCDPDEKYADKQECKVEGECKGEWYYGPYSSCSKPCGGGIMKRQILCVKNNKTVEPKECSMDTIGTSIAECNKQPCGEDEIMPVEPTQVISEEYSEECEGDYYDYEDVTGESFIKVFSTLDSGTTDDLSLAGKELTESTDFTDEDEGSGGFSDDFITIRSSKLPTNESSTVTSETSESLFSSSAPPSISSDLTTAAASSVSVETTSESSTLSDLLTSLITEISSSSLFGSSTPSSVTEEVSETSSSVGSTENSSESFTSPSSNGSEEDATTISPTDSLLSDSTSSSDSSSSGVSAEKLVISTESSSGTSDLPETTISSSGSTDSSDMTSSQSSTDQTSTENTSTDQTLTTDPTSSDITSMSSSEAASTESSESTKETGTTLLDLSTLGSTESSLELSTVSCSSDSDSSGTEVSEASSSSESSSDAGASSTAGLTGSSSISVTDSSTPLISETMESSTDSSESSVGSSTGLDISSTASDSPSSQSQSITLSTPVTDSSSVEGSSPSIVSSSLGVSSTLESLTEGTSETSATDMTPFTALSSSSEVTGETGEETDVTTTSYSEAVFNYTTPSTIQKAIKKEQRMKKCKRRPRKSKCLKSEFGCCPDNKTPAKGPFGKDCPMPKTCKESEFGCCLDEVSPAKGPKGEGCPPSFCEQTLFGCCEDGKTPAQGNDFEGCPVEQTTFIADCSSSEFGCCPDGILSATGPDFQGCLSCNDTEYGCCPDSQTAAIGPDFFGCDVEGISTTTETADNVSSICDNFTHGCCPDGISEAEGPDFLGCSCSTTEFGCCPDGNTTATGPNQEGCPPECKGGEYGCCDDNVTFAHGPNKEGCCLLTQHGCCPDNILPARGPNLEGCGCEWTPYGCCPDNRTAARGPSNEGCGCQYTPHGCCPNNYTPAAGPEFQGCPCHTFQFGCCPDGVTTAIGPHLQGCGCEDTEFGCCSDGRTPAPDASKNCSCAATKYGCCLDGVTEAKGEDFEGCETKLVYKGEYCSLPKQLGECRNLSIKWYFDMEYGGCSRFWYGGCGGNGNKFNNAEECKATCVEAKGKDKCYLPKIEGPCKSYYPRWYYDKERKSCLQFIYSGCLGNANRFETREECDDLCGTQERLDPCDQKVDSGPCAGNYTRWYFDKESQTCSAFQYGGCQGSQNNFLTESACKIKCLQPGKSRELDTCMLPALAGECHNYTSRYYYDVLQASCRPFYYGGCGGNQNNFNTILECQQRCDRKSLPKETPVQFTKDMCFLPSDFGTCSDSQIKWFYNSQDGICKQFRYSGCGGNGNKFESRNDCEYSCGDVQDVCALPRVVGPCNGNLRQWHYDQATQTCQAFDYGGCQGNGNRFDSEEECRSRCVKAKEVVQPPVPAYEDICNFPVDPGPCVQKNIVSWGYDHSLGKCRQFSYGGCEGNANRFVSEEQCERQCGLFKGQDACAGEREVGQCDDAIQKYYFDIPTQSCLEFSYTGCGGNPNRFTDLDECEHICIRKKEPPIPMDEPAPSVNQAICNQPMEPGVCDGNLRRWYYEPRRSSCTPFIYTGCAGNLNNFDSFEACNNFCLPTPKEPSQNEIDVDESKKEHCAEIEKRCSLMSNCRYGLEQWVDAAGCSACRCHEPCLTSPPDCPPAHSCRVELVNNPETGYPEYRGVCRPDIKPGECPVFSSSESCEQECRYDSECPGNFKCCYNGCGTLCTAPRSEEPVTREPPRFPESAAEAPRISEETPSEEVSQEGNYATFNCIAHGRPTPSVTWYREETLLEEGGGKYRLLNNGTLQVIGLEKRDSGRYTCRASNGIQPDASRDYTLTVTVPVRANLSPTTQDIRAGSNVNLTCDVQGDPIPQLTWYKDNVPVTQSERVIVTGNLIILRDLHIEDSGEYKCIADNGYTQAETSVKINVQGVRVPPNCTDSPFLANCKLIIQARYCNHKFYAKFCCKSCTEAGQLPSDGSFVPSLRKRRFIPEKMFRITTR